MKSRVRKIGVSEMRKSAGHFSVSFTHRNRAAYLSVVKLALKQVMLLMILVFLLLNKLLFFRIKMEIL